MRRLRTLLAFVLCLTAICIFLPEKASAIGPYVWTRSGATGWWAYLGSDGQWAGDGWYKKVTDCYGSSSWELVAPLAQTTSTSSYSSYDVSYGAGWKTKLLDVTAQAEDNQSYRAAYGSLVDKLGLQPLPASLSQGYGPQTLYGQGYAYNGPMGQYLRAWNLYQTGYYPGGNTPMGTTAYQQSYSDPSLMQNAYNQSVLAVTDLHSQVAATQASLASKELEGKTVLAKYNAFLLSLNPAPVTSQTRWESGPAIPQNPNAPQTQPTPNAPQQGGQGNDPNYSPPGGQPAPNDPSLSNPNQPPRQPTPSEQGQPNSTPPQGQQSSNGQSDPNDIELGKVVCEVRCIGCHSGSKPKAGLDLTFSALNALSYEALAGPDGLRGKVATLTQPDLDPAKRMPKSIPGQPPKAPLDRISREALLKLFDVVIASKSPS